MAGVVYFDNNSLFPLSYVIAISFMCSNLTGVFEITDYKKKKKYFFVATCLLNMQC